MNITRTRRPSAQSQIDDLRAEVLPAIADLRAVVGDLAKSVQALTDAQTPAKPADPAPAPARRTRAPKAVVVLDRKNRADFVKVAPWAQGLSVNEIVGELVTGTHTRPKGWDVSEASLAKFGLDADYFA